jgi:hypothetical protein
MGGVGFRTVLTTVLLEEGSSTWSTIAPALHGSHPSNTPVDYPGRVPGRSERGCGEHGSERGGEGQQRLTCRVVYFG